MRARLPAPRGPWCALWLALLLGACAADKPPLLAKVQRATPTAESPAPAKAPIVSALPMPVPPDPVSAAPADAPDPVPPSVLYFDSDVYELKDEYRPVLQAHARRLLRDPALQLRIDAYTVDQGPADYNLELARMRAQSVLKHLVALGVPAARLQVVSHGKGRAAARGATLASSRRVELSYR